MGTKNTLLSNTFCVFFVLKNRKLFLKILTKHALSFCRAAEGEEATVLARLF